MSTRLTDEVRNLPKQARLDVLTELTLSTLLEQFAAEEPPKKLAKVLQFPSPRKDAQ
jgi:hypothetical protein